MSDKIKALTVHLDRDYRDDDIQDIVNAIYMIRGIIKVDTHIVTGEDYFARERALAEIRTKVFRALE